MLERYALSGGTVCIWKNSGEHAVYIPDVGTLSPGQKVTQRRRMTLDDFNALIEYFEEHDIENVNVEYRYRWVFWLNLPHKLGRWLKKLFGKEEKCPSFLTPK